MSRKLMLPLLLLLASAVPALYADELPPLTNANILQWLKPRSAGKLAITDDQVIDLINVSSTSFDLSPAAIKALKDGGASPAVLHAMFDASAGIAPAAPPAAAASAAPVPAAVAAVAPAPPAPPAPAPPAPPAPAPPARPAPAPPARPAPAPPAPPAPAPPAPGAPATPTDLSTKFAAGFVGGVEQSGYSSEANNTNAFLNAFFRSPYWWSQRKKPEQPGAPPSPAPAPSGDLAFSIWGRIRLLSGPLPSSVNVVAAVTNPTGTITSSNLANVGQVVDYVFGPEFRLIEGKSDRLSFVAGAGATTPLTSNQVQYSFQAPPANSQQCLQLVAAYPGFLANGSTAPACTLVNKLTNQSVSTISFAAVDRTNFLVKYGGGARLTHTFLSQDSKKTPYTGTVDFIIGQDQSITGGKFHGAVFRVDGIYPLPFGTSSYLYLFGSASMKFTKNIFTNPVVLATAPSPSLPLATTVALLPLTQPDRDFYRFGVGLNIMSIFTKLKGDGTTNNGAPNKGDGTTSKTTGAVVNNP